MSDYQFIVNNPHEIRLGNGFEVQFTNDSAVVAEVEQYPLELVADLWEAGGPYSLQRVSADPWLAAAFFRLCRANAVELSMLNPLGTLSLNANCRKQGAAPTHAIPAEVRDHPA